MTLVLMWQSSNGDICWCFEYMFCMGFAVYYDLSIFSCRLFNHKYMHNGFNQDMGNNGYGSDINWDEVIKKEARGYNDIDLGEVQHVDRDSITTQKGNLNKDRFYIPKKFVQRFDGSTLWFTLTSEDLNLYKLDKAK